MAIEIECVVDAEAKTGEGAFWDVERQQLYWVDIPEGLINIFDPETGNNQQHKSTSLSAVLPRASRVT